MTLFLLNFMCILRDLTYEKNFSALGHGEDPPLKIKKKLQWFHKNRGGSSTHGFS